MPSFADLLRQTERGRIEMLNTLYGEKDQEGRWKFIPVRATTVEGDDFVVRVWRHTDPKKLQRLSDAIEDTNVLYLTAPSIDIFRVFLGEERKYEE